MNKSMKNLFPFPFRTLDGSRVKRDELRIGKPTWQLHFQKSGGSLLFEEQEAQEDIPAIRISCFKSACNCAGDARSHGKSKNSFADVAISV
jgi:hypothetical protein